MNEPKVAQWKEAMTSLLQTQRTILWKQLLMFVLLYRRAFIINGIANMFKLKLHFCTNPLHCRLLSPNCLSTASAKNVVKF